MNRLRTLACAAWSVLTHQRLAVVAIVVTGLAAIPPEWFSGRWKVLAGVLTGIFAVIAKGSMPVADAIGKVEDDEGWGEADAAIASVPDKVDRPPEPLPPASPFTPEKITAIHSPGPVPWQLTCADGPKSEPPADHSGDANEMIPPPAPCPFNGSRTTHLAIYFLPLDKPKKRRKRK